MFTKESLDTLRSRIDLVDVLSSYLPLQRAGASYKTLCPFHEEKTPSFIVQRGDSHYHCFGCGAHGDAISFLMTHLKMGFAEAVEHLAERFQVTLEKGEEKGGMQGPSKASLRKTLELAADLYHYLLLHSEEGQQALSYLYSRGLDLDFIRTFHIGFSPASSAILTPYLNSQGIDEPLIAAAGLISYSQSGRRRDFFSDRVMFPIRDLVGHVIGFSGRKFKEETFGGKYINSPETPLFKKSKILFGLSYSRAKIAKEGCAIIVEGQIDALRLIHVGFDYTVAGQGTAFGEDHVKELIQMGAKKVFLAMDSDLAGKEAAVKIGNLFQKKGIDVFVISLPNGQDPDSFIRTKGPSAFEQAMREAEQYLPFLFSHLSGSDTSLSAAKKNEVVNTIAQKIREWNTPVMVHESLKKLSELANLPELLFSSTLPTNPFLKKRNVVPQLQTIDPNKILEGDLIRWLLVASPSCPRILSLIEKNIPPEILTLPIASEIYQTILSLHKEGKGWDLFSLGSAMITEEAQEFLSSILQRKINLSKAEEGCKETIIQLLKRQWMSKREEIRKELSNPDLSETELLLLVKEFDRIKNAPPEFISV